MRSELPEEHLLLAVRALHTIVWPLIQHVLPVFFLAAEAVVVLGGRLILYQLQLRTLLLVSLGAAELAETAGAVEVVLLVAAGGGRRIWSYSASSELIVG